MDLRQGDCLELLKTLDKNSVDLVFADLPYGQINAKWDCKINLDELWVELKRVGKDTTPFIFTCTTRFGYELIKSNEKMFRFDIVWMKSRKAGFLQSKKQPLRQHEMIYFFYKKQPFYDISSHQHKFKDKDIEEDEMCIRKEDSSYGNSFKTSKKKEDHQQKYDPPLPSSVIEENKIKSKIDSTYGKTIELGIPHTTTYDPPLPSSVIEESCYGSVGRDCDEHKEFGTKGKNQVLYEPTLPSSVLQIKSINLKAHSTAKPPDLMKWILKYYSKEGDTVLDPTMGSNPMGLACKEMNRKFIGFEKDPKIFKFANERVL